MNNGHFFQVSAYGGDYRHLMNDNKPAKKKSFIAHNGVPIIFPLATLADFKPMARLQITNGTKEGLANGMPFANCPLPITNGQLPISTCQLPIANGIKNEGFIADVEVDIVD